MIASALAQVDAAGIKFVDQIWWFMSRAAGIVAWLLLSCSMVLGLMQSTRRSALPSGWSLDLHRFLSMLSLIFLTIHLAALVPDEFVHFGLAELFIPMQSSWQPGAVAWGIVGFWLMVSVEVSSLLRARIPNRVWRAIHLLSFVVWISATVHLLTAGTDASHPIFRAVQVVVIATISIMFVQRIADARRSRNRADKASASVGSLPIEESIDIHEVDTREGRELPA